MSEEYKHVYNVIGIIIIAVIVFMIVKELTKSKTKITEIIRDETGRITQIVEKEI